MKRKGIIISTSVFILVLAILFGFSFLPSKSLTMASHALKSEQIHDMKKTGLSKKSVETDFLAALFFVVQILEKCTQKNRPLL